MGRVILKQFNHLKTLPLLQRAAHYQTQCLDYAKTLHYIMTHCFAYWMKTVLKPKFLERKVISSLKWIRKPTSLFSALTPTYFSEWNMEKASIWRIHWSALTEVIYHQWKLLSILTVAMQILIQSQIIKMMHWKIFYLPNFL